MLVRIIMSPDLILLVLNTKLKTSYNCKQLCSHHHKSIYNSIHSLMSSSTTSGRSRKLSKGESRPSKKQRTSTSTRKRLLPTPKRQILPQHHPLFTYLPGIIQIEPQTLQEELKKLPFPGQRVRAISYGKTYVVPRDVVVFAKPGITYTFNSGSGETRPFTAWIVTLCQKVQNILKQQADIIANFNLVVVNRYNDGRDSIASHSDDEPEIDQSQPIVSLSFGATRTFFVTGKPHTSRAQERWKVDLGDGDVLVMHAGAQSLFKHSLPIRRRSRDTRVNLTFRCIKP